MLGALTERLERVQHVLRRATLAPALVRGGIVVSLALAMLVAWPVAVLATALIGPLLLVAIYPAVAPRGRGTTFAIVVAAAGWVTGTSWYDGSVALWRVVTLASLLYIGHSLAALAAVLPYDATVNLDVVTLWLLRAGGAVLIAAVLTVIVLGLAETLGGGAFVVATLVGLAAAVTSVLLLSRLLRRPGN